MPWLLVIRLASIVVTATICLLAIDRPDLFAWTTYSLGFAHYALALGYGSGPMRQLVRAPAGLPLLGALVLLSVGLYESSFPLFVCFGAHHALNEAYLRRASENSTVRTSLGGAATVFHFAAYLVILRHGAELSWLHPGWSWAALLLAGVALVRKADRIRPAAARSWLDLWAPELTSALLVVASLSVRITFLQIVLFHFVLWGLLPIERLAPRGRAALTRYIALSAAAFASFLLVSPVGIPAIRLGVATFTLQFFFWSYAHILLSFALSDAHPDWAVRLFRGATPSRALAS